jgi:hypothetical protein
MTARSVRVPGPRSLLGRAWASNRPLAFVGASMMIVLMVALTGLLVDPRIITGAPAWLKPMKFAISISIYCFTLLWMLTFVRGRPRLVGLVSWVTAVALFVEMAHFVGLHGLQALPLFGYLLALLAPEWLRMRHRVPLVWMAGVSYLCLIGLLTWQALRGQPVISPNARTLGALLALLLAAGTAVFAVVLQARRGRRR